MSRIITFYSYKGGVGRTFSLANIAVLLSKRGKRVLLIDWDLEAPGLLRYFKPFLPKKKSSQKGLIHLLNKAAEHRNAEWQPYVIQAKIQDNPAISILYSGDNASDYVEKVRQFSWGEFFENRSGGDVLDRWRKEWKDKYDFVLIDSRTGITDAGGVCTVFLPDVLVLVFSANEQSFEGGMKVAFGIQEARRNLAVPRPPVAVLPLPGRFDGRDEVDEAKKWLDRFGRELKPFYDDWLPTRFAARQILELTKLPYVAKFSFGEPLPVMTHGISDPEFPGFYLENIARLLASDFREATHILSPELSEIEDAIAELRAKLSRAPIDETEISNIFKDLEDKIESDSTLFELLNEIGTALLAQLRYDSAELFFRRAIAMGEKQSDLHHNSFVSSIARLAQLLHTTKRFHEAETLYRQALYVTEKYSDPDDPAVTSAYNNLADVMRDMGRPEEAMDLYRQALYTAEKYSRPGDPAVTSAYNNLAGVMRDMGRPEEAMDLYRQSLHAAEKYSRPGDPAVTSAYNNLAGVMRDMGRPEEAMDLYRQALNYAEEYSRPGDPAVTSAYNNLAGVMRDMGRPEEAMDLYRQALNYAEEYSRPGDPAVTSAYNNLAGVMRDMGRPEEAMDLYRQALNYAEEYSRPGDPAVTSAYNNLAGVMRDMGRPEEAMDLYRQALNYAEEYSRPGDPAVTSAYNNLAGVMRDMGRPEEAMDLYRQALNYAEEYSRPGDPAVTSAYNNLAGVMRDMGRPEEAMDLYRQALNYAEEYSRPGDQTMALVLNSLAETYLSTGNLEEAEPLLRRAAVILEDAVDQSHPEAVKVRQNLMSLLTDRGRADEAEQLSMQLAFDAFIAYDNLDKQIVRKLAQELKSRGLRVWLDEWELIPGLPWQESLKKVIKTVPSAVLCIGKSGREPLEGSEIRYSLSVLMERHVPIIPVLLPGIPPKFSIPVFLRQFTYVDLREGITKNGLDRIVWGITGIRQRR